MDKHIESLLTALNGTPDQIAEAEVIRERIVLAIKQELDGEIFAALDRGEAMSADLLSKCWEGFAEAIRTTTDALWWISRKGSSVEDVRDDLAHLFVNTKGETR